MKNVIQKIGKGIEVAAVDTAKTVVGVVTFVDKAARVADTIINDYPEFRPVFSEILSTGATVATDVFAVTAEKGLVWSEDAKTIAAVESFFAYMKNTAIPAVEKLCATLDAEITK